MLITKKRGAFRDYMSVMISARNDGAEEKTNFLPGQKHLLLKKKVVKYGRENRRICVGEDFADMEEFGKIRRDYPAKFLSLPMGEIVVDDMILD